MYLPEACLFDLDGVLLDTEVLHSEAWSTSAARFGIKLTLDQLNSLRGKRRIECAEQIIKSAKKSISTNTFLKTHQPISEKLMRKVKAISGAETIVKWCFQNKLPMALVTSSTSSSVDVKTASHVWINLIRTKVYGDDSSLQKGKPAPDPFLLATKKLEVDPKCCWAIEDSISGVTSALAAGCKVWMLNNLIEDIGQKRIFKDMPNLHKVKHLSQVLYELKNNNESNIIG